MDSSRLKEGPRSLDALAEVGVLDGGQHDEIHVSMEQVLQRLSRPEIGVGVPDRGPVVERHDEIEVTRRLFERYVGDVGAGVFCRSEAI